MVCEWISQLAKTNAWKAAVFDDVDGH